MINAEVFNVRDAQGRLICPACGYPDYSLDPAYDDRGGLVGTTICPCCKWEPGFDDDPGASARAEGTILASLRRYRSGWGEEAHWSGREAERPNGWDGAKQLQHLFEVAPHVR